MKKMSGVQDQLEIKFRLFDGSDIGPKSFPTATSVATLKESILAQWPKGLFGLSQLKYIHPTLNICIYVVEASL